ncbi:shematrin-like protein 1 isoform X2 [Macrosteles quadrilineatus]|uniref:shematrin-like protein 1 isoform X2 n=1 Tax=Macrosteles quadrilineatus TaxID=74068 RepID=UPI0023E25E0D|nr:shematrin-like protein 1 isoform X2 [Macrosteles quadrilineatus]
MAGLPSMVLASVAITLLVADSYAFPGPVPAGPGGAPRAALGGAPGGAPIGTPAEARAAGAPHSKEAKDLEGSETFGLGYYGYGYGYPLAYSSYYYPRYSNYYRPYRYYSSYSYPYSYWDDWYSSYYSYW